MKYIILITLLTPLIAYSQTGDTEIEGNLYVRGSIIQGSEISPGVQVLESITTDATTLSVGATNHFSGWQAGLQIAQGNGTGTRNSAFGNYAQQMNRLGSGNTSVGLGAGLRLSGSWNTNIGHLSGYNLSGEFSTFLGNFTGINTTSGNQNTFLGSNSGQLNVGGSWNTFVGTSSGREHTTGTHNVYIGSHNGRNDAGGNRNVFIGANTDAGISNCTNSVAIGYDVSPFGSNRVVIGNSSMTRIGGYASWSNLSDLRYKINIKQNVPGIEFIMKLQPVTYNLDKNKLLKLNATYNEVSAKAEDGNIPSQKGVNTKEAMIESIEFKSKQTYTGLIAQEVLQAANELNYEFSGVLEPENKSDHYRLAYSELIVPLIKAVQEQQKKINELRKEIDELKAK